MKKEVWIEKSRKYLSFGEKIVKIGPVDPKIIWLKLKQESLALASMARDDSPASSTAAAAARRPMRGKVGSEFELN